MVFEKLLRRHKPESDESYRRLSPAITDAILGTVGLRSIPPLPPAAQRAFELSTDPNAEARDFVDVIESDESLSARVLKIANSVYFDRGKSSKTIEEAVQVIGTNELRCLLNATSLTDLFPSSHAARFQLWANDIATACIARELARRTMPGKEETAFLAGLMHDIGKLLLLQRNQREFEQVLARVQQGVSYSRAEEEIFPFNHCEVGQLIGERWNFSKELLDPIRNHHRPWSYFRGETTPSLAGVVKCADVMAHSFGIGLTPQFGKFQRAVREELGSAWIFAGIRREEQEEFAAEVSKSVSSEYELYLGRPA